MSCPVCRADKVTRVKVKTFAIDVLISLGLSGDRFQLLVGLSFLLIVFFSPDGILGLWDRWREVRNRDPLIDRAGGGPE